MEKKTKLILPLVEYETFTSFGELGTDIYNLCQKLKDKFDITIILPFYKTIFTKNLALTRVNNKTNLIQNFEVDFYNYKEDNINFYFISESTFFNNIETIYDNNNEPRFAFFALCTSELIKYLSLEGVIHIYDWHLGLLPFILKKQNIKNKILLTINNPDYQGVADFNVLKIAKISTKYFYSGELEFYNKVNFLKCAIDYSDKIVIKSKDFFEEIEVQKANALLLEGVIKANLEKIDFISNYISDDYSPNDNNLIYANYSADLLEGKLICKTKLQNELNFLVHTEIPIIAISAVNITKYEISLINSIIQYLLLMEIQIVILGYNLSDFEKNIKQFSFANNCSAISLEPSEKNIHKVLSGSDIILDLSIDFRNKDLIKKALKYGIIPIIFKESKEIKNLDVNFRLFNLTRDDLINTIKYTINKYYYLNKWNQKIIKAMQLDFSTNSHVKIYSDLIVSLS